MNKVVYFIIADIIPKKRNRAVHSFENKDAKIAAKITSEKNFITTVIKFNITKQKLFTTRICKFVSKWKFFHAKIDKK